VTPPDTKFPPSVTVAIIVVGSGLGWWGVIALLRSLLP
jgi:hypothetical protein